MAGRRANSAYMLLGQIFGKAGLFVSLMIYSRILEDAAFGELLFAVSIGLVVTFLSDMGATMLTTRRIASGSDPGKALPPALTLRSILSVVSISIVLLSGWVGGYSQRQLLLISIVSFGFVMDGFCESAFAVFRGGEVMINESLARIFQGITGVVLAVYALNTGRDVVFASLTYVLRQFPALLFIGFTLKRLGYRPDHSGRSLNSAVKLLKDSVPLGIIGILMATGLRVDSVFVKAFWGDEAVAAYQQSVKILETLILIVTPTLIPGALFASLCLAVKKGWGETRARIAWMTELFTVLAFLLIIPLWVLGTFPLKVLWGDAFLRGVELDKVLTTFRIVLVTLPVAYYFHLFMSLVIAEEKQRDALPAVSFAVFLQLVMLFFAVRRIGIEGAAAACFLLYSSSSFFLGMQHRREKGPTGFIRGIRRPIAGLIPVIIFIKLVSMNVIAEAIVSTAIFTAIWISVGGYRIFPWRISPRLRNI